MVFGSVMVGVIVGIAAAAILGAVALWRRGTKSRWQLWGATALAAVLGLAGAIVLMGASHVVRVHPDMTTTEERLLGSTTEHIGGKDVELSGFGSKTTVIVNESDRALEVRALVYGELSPGAMVPPDVTIAPHSAHKLHASVDYIGPGNAPSSVSTKGGGKLKFWLTW